MCPFFILIMIVHERFCWLKYFQYLIFLPVLSHLGLLMASNGNATRASSQTSLCGFIEALTALRDFHFVKSISVLYELCSSKAWDLLTALNHLRWSLFFDKNCTYRMCIKKETPAQVFYFEFCEICKNTFFVEHFAFNYRKN